MNPIARALQLAARKTDTTPSDRAKEAGNYAKGKLPYKGMTIAIENPKGSKRSGMDANGKKWECTLPAAYGYIKNTVAGDGDHVDVYVGPDHDSDKVWVIDQIDAKTGKYDEPKCMLSFPSKQAAVDAYTKAFSDGRGKDRIGAVTELSTEHFKAWVRDPKASKYPLGDLKKGYAYGGRVGFADGGTLALANRYYQGDLAPEAQVLPSDLERRLQSYPPLRDFPEFHPSELRGTGQGESRDPRANPNTKEYLAPAYEMASPLAGAYGMGQGIGEVAKNVQAQDYSGAAWAAAPLIAGMVVPGGPKGMRMAREIDARGFYSPTLEAAKALPQEKGTVAQFRSMLLDPKYGGKPKELEAVGFDKAYPDPQAKVSRSEIEQYLRDNRVQLGEKRLSGPMTQEQIDALPPEDYAGQGSAQYQSYSTPGGIPGSYREVVTTLPRRDVDDPARVAAQEKLRQLTDAHQAERRAGRGEAHAAEIVRLREDYNTRWGALGPAADTSNYTSSHWSGITNPLLHYRQKDFLNHADPTSVGRPEKVTPSPPHGSGDLESIYGKPEAWTEPSPSKTRVLDEMQSDWAQRARDSGTRDPAAIATLEKASSDAWARQEAARDALIPLVAKHKYLAPEHVRENPGEAAQHILMSGKLVTPEIQAELGPAYDAWSKARNEGLDIGNKLQAARAGVPSAPYISNTSDWVDLGLKQALIDAARDPSVNRLAWAPGKVQADRYNLENHIGELYHWREPNGRIGLSAYTPGGGTVLDQRVVSEAELPGVVGNEMAARILGGEGRPGPEFNQPEDVRVIAGEGLRMGGEGMKSFYGDITPEGYKSGIVGTRLQKLVKGLDPEAARVEPHQLPDKYGNVQPAGVGRWRAESPDHTSARHFDNEAEAHAFARGAYTPESWPTYPSIPITPKMREEILKKGLPLFLTPLGLGLVEEGTQDSGDPVQDLIRYHYGNDEG